MDCVSDGPACRFCVPRDNPALGCLNCSFIIIIIIVVVVIVNYLTSTKCFLNDTGLQVKANQLSFFHLSSFLSYFYGLLFAGG